MGQCQRQKYTVSNHDHAAYSLTETIQFSSSKNLKIIDTGNLKLIRLQGLVSEKAIAYLTCTYLSRFLVPVRSE